MCEHNTSMVIYAGADTNVEICEWGCDQILVYKILPNGTFQLIREVEHPQVAALREEVERLRAAIKPFAEIPCLENFDDDQLFDPAGGVLAGNVRAARRAYFGE